MNHTKWPSALFIDRCLAQSSSEASSSSRKDSVRRQTDRHYLEGDSQLEVSIRSLISEIRKSHGKGNKKHFRSQRGWKTPGKLDLLDKLSMAQMRSQELKWPSKGLHVSVPLLQHMSYEYWLGMFLRLLTMGAAISVILMPGLEICLLPLICLSQNQYEDFSLVLYLVFPYLVIVTWNPVFSWMELGEKRGGRELEVI